MKAYTGNIDEGESPGTTILRETKEETGYEIVAVQKSFTLYSTPNSVTEWLHYFVAAYTAENRKRPRGGLASEQENITVEELLFEND